MKILFLVNIPLPETNKLFNIKVGNSGGWLIGTLNSFSTCPDMNISVAFPMKVNRVLSKTGKKIKYYAFPQYKNRNYDANIYDKNFEYILEETSPNLVHIFGTELPHSLAMANTCRKNNVTFIVSVQGLVSTIFQHFYSGLPNSVVYNSTIRNIIRHDNIRGLKKIYYELAKNESALLRKSNYVIGRTTFDKAYSTQVNPSIIYYSCNESLRDTFYCANKWDIESKENYSIFLSQAHYPIKGAHYMIEALRIILEKYPDAKLYIGGKNIIKSNTLKDKILITYYGKYLRKKIKKFGLSKSVIFTGPLSESQIHQRYLKSHVFVCPSSIENSPNSLGEAMILGVPCVASYTGGIPDMLVNKEEGFLFQHDAPYMLAYYICKIFGDDRTAMGFSRNAREHALKTHDRTSNLTRLLEIYQNIGNVSNKYLH